MSKIEYTEMIGKAAIVTGAASKYGKEITKQLIEQGVRVTMIDNDKKALAEAVTEMFIEVDGKKIFRAVQCQCDVSSPRQVELAMGVIEKSISNLNYLINAVGPKEYPYYVAKDVAEIWRSGGGYGPQSMVFIGDESIHLTALNEIIERGVKANTVNPHHGLRISSKVEDVAKAALWLLSSESSAVSDDNIILAGI